MLTLKGDINGSEFVCDGEKYHLRYNLGVQLNVYINCMFNDDGSLSVFRIFKAG